MQYKSRHHRCSSSHGILIQVISHVMSSAASRWKGSEEPHVRAGVGLEVRLEAGLVSMQRQGWCQCRVRGECQGQGGGGFGVHMSSTREGSVRDRAIY